MKRTTHEVNVAGKRLTFSNLEKVIYPKTGFTKAEVIDYYHRISPALLPHLKNRPLTFKRYPDGVDGFFFYEKNCPAHRPEWVQTAKVWSEGNNRDMYYCIANDLPTLLWAANLAVLELHTSLSLCKNVLQPSFLAFDLDPGPPADIVNCCEVGLMLRDIFSEMHLQCFPKTSGSKGLQVYVPLNTKVTYDETKTFAQSLAQLLEREHPNKITSIMKKSLRHNKVFIDWSQNDDHKTTVCPYSLRAMPRPTVSTPVTWEELGEALDQEDPSLVEFEAPEVIARVGREVDLFEPVLSLKQKLPEV